MKKIFALITLIFIVNNQSLFAQTFPITITTIQQFGNQDYDSYGIKIITTSSNNNPYTVRVHCQELETDTTYTLSALGQQTCIMAFSVPIQLVPNHIVNVTVKQGNDSTSGQVWIYTLPPSGIDVLLTNLDTINGGNNLMISGNVYNYDGFEGTATITVYNSQNIIMFQENIPYFELQTFVEPTIIATQTDITQWSQGTYGVTLQASNPWVTSNISDTVYFTKDWTTKIDESIVKEFSVWPNPFNDLLYLNNIKSETDIYIYDMFGKLFITNHISKLSSHTISTNSLSQGLYFITIKTKDLQKTIVLHKD